MKTLLVPIDFYGISKNAISYATTLCKALNAKITLLHAYQSFPSGPVISERRKREEIELFRKESEEKLKKLCSEIEPSQHCRCEFINDEGSVKDIILKYTKLLKPEILIMGSKNKGFVDKVFFGSTSGKVIKEVDATVLIVPESPDFKLPKKIAFASDYYDSDKVAIGFLAYLTQKLQANLAVVHIMEENQDINFERSYLKDFEEEVKNTMPEQKIHFNLIQGNNILRELEKYVAEKKIDVLAVAKTQKKFMERLIIGSISQKLFNHLYIPLLIFQARNEPRNFF